MSSREQYAWLNITQPWPRRSAPRAWAWLWSPVTQTAAPVRCGSVLTYLLGAPGSGKSAIAGPLSDQLPNHVILDWDAFMAPASELAGRDVTRSPRTWPTYRRLIRLVVELVVPAPCVLLGVCAPAELDGWPIDAWVLLDCNDEKRRERLADHSEPDAVDEAIADAASYRALGLPTIDTTSRATEQVAEQSRASSSSSSEGCPLNRRREAEPRARQNERSEGSTCRLRTPRQIGSALDLVGFGMVTPAEG